MSGRKLPDVPLEFEFANDAFALVPESTEDGARVQRELDEAYGAKKAQEKAQIQLPIAPPAGEG